MLRWSKTQVLLLARVTKKLNPKLARLAQLVEQWTGNPEVLRVRAPV